jgi:hypothetical protein
MIHYSLHVNRRCSEDVEVLLPLLKRLHTVRNLPQVAQVEIFESQLRFP